MKSPAKVNLGLKVLSKRPDGYHEIDTIFQEIDWCDELTFAVHDAWQLEVVGDVPSGEDNLVTKAARLLALESDIPCKARVTLVKSIPSKAGLGGGSSNAAIALLGLNRLWELRLSFDRLHNLAANLGSDCAFFLKGGLAHGKGKGEMLDWLCDCVNGVYLVVIPPFGVSTAWAYTHFGSHLTEVEKNVIFKSELGIPQEIYGFTIIGCNYLENIVLRENPELANIKRVLADNGANLSLLSGSGSAVFGIFSDSSRAKHAALQLGSRYTIRICRPVSRPRS